MITINEKKLCCGCSACENICPKDAIIMQKDSEGFWYPQIDEKKCVNCNLCEKVCPIITNKNGKASADVISCYVGQLIDKKELLEVSSGGAFWGIACAIIDETGVIYGAKQVDLMSVEHSRASTKKEVELLRRSKYLQSNISALYKQVKQDLEDNKTVLFTGTPCQIAGLKGYLRREYNNLITCEVICHGVPSPTVWSNYLTEYQAKNNTTIEHVVYRDKSLGWKNNQYKITCSDGKEEFERSVDHLFHAGYLQGLYYRPSCGECKFANITRTADITLADFWGYSGDFQKETQPLGLSLIITNNEKGDKWLKKANKYLVWEKVEMQDAISSCHHLTSHPEHSIDRGNFFKAMETKGFYFAANKYVISNKRVDFIKRIRRKFLKLILNTGR